MNDIAANIRSLRKEKKLSQEQFAQQLHVTRQTVSAWERGLSRPGLENIRQIAQSLGVEEDQVLYGPEAGTKAPRYKSVSFWPVLGIIPVWSFGIMLIAWLLYTVVGYNPHDSSIIILAGQLFLSMLVVFCYCALKDEIRNRDYYDRTELKEEDTGE